jgi:hypothetical protein
MINGYADNWGQFTFTDHCFGYTRVATNDVMEQKFKDAGAATYVWRKPFHYRLTT